MVELIIERILKVIAADKIDSDELATLYHLLAIYSAPEKDSLH